MALFEEINISYLLTNFIILVNLALILFLVVRKPNLTNDNFGFYCYTVKEWEQYKKNKFLRRLKQINLSTNFAEYPLLDYFIFVLSKNIKIALLFTPWALKQTGIVPGNLVLVISCFIGTYKCCFIDLYEGAENYLSLFEKRLKNVLQVLIMALV